MKFLNILFVLLLFPFMGFSQVPTNAEAYEQLKSMFPVTIGVQARFSYAKARVANDPDLAALLKKLVDGKVVELTPTPNGKILNLTTTRSGRHFLMPSLTTDDRVVFAGGFLLLEGVTEVMPHPDRDYTYIVTTKVKVQERTQFAKGIYALGSNTFKIEVSATSNGWRPSPGGNATAYVEAAEKSAFGREALDNFDFYSRMPELVIGTWVADTKNEKKQNAFHFDPGEMTYWYYKAADKDTIRGKYKVSEKTSVSRTSYFRGYRLTPRSGKLINLSVEKLKDGNVRIGNQAKFGSQKFKSVDGVALKSAANSSAIRSLSEDVLPGHWENKKGYYISFNEDGTAECYLTKKQVNFGRRKGSKVEEDIIEWSGNYWVWAPEGKKFLAIVFGEDGDEDAEDYIVIYQRPEEIIGMDEKYLSIGLSQFFLR